MKAKKSLGQHFLVDNEPIERLLDYQNINQNSNLVEIGAGRGDLTQALLSRNAKVLAIEFDTQLIEYLNHNINHPNLTLVQADALKYDFKNVPDEAIGNLPYNIASEIIFKLLMLRSFNRLTFLIQHEVALRLVAKINTKDYSRLTLMSAFFCDVNLLFCVYPSSFLPQPKVMSAFVCLKPHTRFEDKYLPAFTKLVRQAYSQRRKTIKNSLTGITDTAMLISAGIDPKLRPENIEIENYYRLAQILNG